MTLSKLLELVQSLITLYGGDTTIYGYIKFTSGIAEITFSGNNRK